MRCKHVPCLIVSLLVIGMPLGLAGGTNRFSSRPSTQDLMSARIFEEPLVPIGEPSTQEENTDLARALETYLAIGEPSRLEALIAFLGVHPQSPWRASIMVNLGIVYRHSGYLTRSLNAWEEAWALAKQTKDERGQGVALRALGELAELNARLGRVERLETLLGESDGLVVTGLATEKLAGAREGLHLMRTRPDRAFRCGPLALTMIRAIKDPRAPWDPKLDALDSTQRGTSLAMNYRWAQELGMKLQLARRAPGAPVVLPALVHWKAGHFGALTKSEGGRYLIQDPTFGEETWVSAKALDDEASGFFLVPEGPLPKGWSGVTVAEAKDVWGCGAWGPGRPDDTNPDSPKVPKGCGEGHSGMPVSAFHANVVSLNLVDEPIGYTPPRGPRVGFTATYNHREYGQPQIFDFSNFGPKWVHEWMSYIKDDTSNSSANVTVVTRGGGSLTFKTTAPGIYAVENRRQAVLRKGSETSYVLTYRDGHTETFAQPDRLITGARRVFMTEVADKEGNAVRLAYDSSMRLVTITDAIGQVTTLTYGNTESPLKITQVTDPFGRIARFEYGANGFLSKITDVVGLSTSFTYGPTVGAPTAPADFINAMTTPYGTTRYFTDSSTGSERWIESEDPMGFRDRLEAGSSYTSLVPVEPIPNVPELDPSYLNPRFGFRNSLYWDKRAYADRQRNFVKAHIFQWGHGVGGFASGILVGEKKPLENRIWLVHAGDFWGGVIPTVAAHEETDPSLGMKRDQGKVGGLGGKLILGQNVIKSKSGLSEVSSVGSRPPVTPVWEGAFNVVTRVIRILEDGTIQVTKNDYDANGILLRTEDPSGRSTSYTWSSDGLDLLEVWNTTAGLRELLGKYTYNAQHKPLTATDASGKVTTFTYNSVGQINTIQNPKNETTTLSYDSNGYLMKVEGAVAGSATTFTYDSVGRVRTVTNPDAFTLTYDYDNLDRRTKVTYPDGTSENTIFDRLDIGATVDRKGQWTYMAYNPLRQLVEVKDPQGRITRMDWCGCGQLEALVDPLGRFTNWQRDLQGRVVAKIFPDLKSTKYSYDATGRLSSRKDAKGQVTTYGYFVDGNLQQVAYSGGTTSTPNSSYTYDPAYNRLASMTDGTGTTNYSYYPVTSTPGLGAGRLATVSRPLANSTITYGYDELGRVQTRDISGSNESRQFDALGRMSSVTNPLGTFTYGYDGLTNRLKGVTFPNGQTTAFSYFDVLGDQRLKQIANTTSTSTNISTFDYTYDPNGQIQTWSQKADAQTPKIYSFTYDAVGQLLGAQLNDGSPIGAVLKSYIYAYDGSGNRLSEQIDDQLTTAAYNNLNQLQAQRSTAITAPIVAGGGKGASAKNRIQPKAKSRPAPRKAVTKPNSSLFSH